MRGRRTAIFSLVLVFNGAWLLLLSVLLLFVWPVHPHNVDFFEGLSFWSVVMCLAGAILGWRARAFRFARRAAIFGAVVVMISVVQLAVRFCFALYGLGNTPIVQIKENENRNHVAELLRSDWIDLNFGVKVDGKRVYWSPDFYPREPDLHERLIWDTSGRIVILEVAGERLFGYDAERLRPLSPAEIMNASLPAIPSLESTGFEGRFPRELLETNAARRRVSAHD